MPKKQYQRLRDNRVTLRMTARELSLFNERFSQSGARNRTDFVLRAIQNESFVVIKELVPSLAELKRQGNNLNQIARQLNEGVALDADLKRLIQEHDIAYNFLIKEAKKNAII